MWEVLSSPWLLLLLPPPHGSPLLDDQPPKQLSKQPRKAPINQEEHPHTIRMAETGPSTTHTVQHGGIRVHTQSSQHLTQLQCRDKVGHPPRDLYSHSSPRKVGIHQRVHPIIHYAIISRNRLNIRHRPPTNGQGHQVMIPLEDLELPLSQDNENRVPWKQEKDVKFPPNHPPVPN